MLLAMCPEPINWLARLPETSPRCSSPEEARSILQTHLIVCLRGQALASITSLQAQPTSEAISEQVCYTSSTRTSVWKAYTPSTLLIRPELRLNSQPFKAECGTPSKAEPCCALKPIRRSSAGCGS